MPIPNALEQQLSKYPPYVEWYIRANGDDLTADVLSIAQQWKDSIEKPDSVVTSGFGLTAVSVVDRILGRVNGIANLQTLRDQLAEGVMGGEEPQFRMSDHEVEDLAHGVLKVRSRWEVKLEPYPSMDQGVLHTTLQAKWSSPYIPAFQAQVTINDSEVGDPSKFLATGVLGPDTGVVRLYASFDKEAGSLTLATEDGTYSIVTTFQDDQDSKAFHDMLEKGKIADDRGKVSTLVKKNLLHPKILTAFHLSDEDKKIVVDEASSRLLVEMAKQKAQALGDEAKQLTDSGELLDQHHTQLKLKMAMDQLKLAGEKPTDPSPLRNLDEETLADMANTLIANRQYPRPLNSGGSRALWMSKLGWILNSDFNGMKNQEKEGWLDERQREYLSWQLSRMMNDKDHRNHRNHNKWRKLTHQIDALTKLIERPPQDRVLTDAVEKAKHSLPLHELQQEAEQELHNQVEEEEVEEVELPPEVPKKKKKKVEEVEESGSESEGEYTDDYAELHNLLQADPSKVPLFLRDDEEDEENELIDAVDRLKIERMQQKIANVVTKARRQCNTEGKHKKHKKSIHHSKKKKEKEVQSESEEEKDE